jgi:hypothetical protein
MDFRFPRPMLNSPVDNDIVGSQFLGKVLSRVAEASEARKAVIEMGHVCASRSAPDYAEIVNQINLCIAEIRPRLNTAELTQMLLTTPIAEIETLLKKLQKLRDEVH